MKDPATARQTWALVWCVLTFAIIAAAIQQFSDGHVLLGLSCLGVTYALSPKTNDGDRCSHAGGDGVTHGKAAKR